MIAGRISFRKLFIKLMYKNNIISYIYIYIYIYLYIYLMLTTPWNPTEFLKLYKLATHTNVVQALNSKFPIKYPINRMVLI